MGACVSVAKKSKAKANKQAPAPEAHKEEVASNQAPAPELQVVVVAEEKIRSDDENAQETITFTAKENNKATKEPKMEEHTTVEPKQEEPKMEGPTTVEPKQEEPKMEEPVKVEPKPKEPKKEEATAGPAKAKVEGKANEEKQSC